VSRLRKELGEGRVVTPQLLAEAREADPYENLEPMGKSRRAHALARRSAHLPPYLMNRISEYFGSGHRSSATIFSSRSPISRTFSSAVSWLSRA
jgi:hypothetical protein